MAPFRGLWLHLSCFPHAATFAGVVAAVPSQCNDGYARWVTSPDVFVRTDEPQHMQGLHVACIWRSSDGQASLEAHLNGVDLGEPVRAQLPEDIFAGWKEFRAALKGALGFSKRTNDWVSLHLKQAFGIFAEDGRRLSSVQEVVAAKVVLVIEGGQWFWPPMREGYVRELPGTPYELETLSVQPVVFRVRHFLKIEECDEIMKLGAGRMRESPVSLMDKDKGKAATEFRTSTQAQLDSTDFPVLDEIDHRVSALTKIPVTHNEDVQILQYKETQYYAGHMDNWDPMFYGSNTAWIHGGHFNRMITVFWYLIDVPHGGETIFPRAHGLPQPMDMYSCDRGMKVRPEKGAVIFWYSIHPNGNTNPNGLHAGCPVEGGVKWSANYWVWNKPRQSSWQEQMPDGGVDDLEPAELQSLSVNPQVDEDSPKLVTFENEHPTKTAYIFFKAGEGDEHLLGQVGPGEQTSMTTYSGHVWNVRAGDDAGSRLLDSVAMTRDKTERIFIEAYKSDL